MSGGGDIAPILPRLAKLLPLLGSDQPGEVTATAAAIGRLLGTVGASWHDLAATLVPSAQRTATPQPRPRPRQQPRPAPAQHHGQRYQGQDWNPLRRTIDTILVTNTTVSAADRARLMRI